MTQSLFKSTLLYSFITLVLFLLSVAPPAHAGNDKYENIIKSYQYDQSLPLSVQIVKYKRYTDCFMLRIIYSSTNNQRVPTILFEPSRASMWHPLPAIILLHDLGSSKEKLAKLGHFFAATGYSCLLIDEYGHGERAGKGIDGKPNQGTMSLNGLHQTIVDVRRAIDYMDTRLHVSPKRIGIIGISLGAVIAADVAGIDDRVKSLVMISGGGDGAAILQALGKHQRTIKQDDTNKANNNTQLARNFSEDELEDAVDPLTFAEHIAPRAVLMMNGRNDSLITSRRIEELYNAFDGADGSNAKIVWFDAGHKLPLDRIYPPLRLWLFENL